MSERVKEQIKLREATRDDRKVVSIEYPTRCRIIDVTGQTFFGLPIRTPDTSRPHVGKEGTAYEDEEHGVRLELDDGTVLYGYQCWWEAV
jgi:hypothetical protein